VHHIDALRKTVNEHEHKTVTSSQPRSAISHCIQAHTTPWYFGARVIDKTKEDKMLPAERKMKKDTGRWQAPIIKDLGGQHRFEVLAPDMRSSTTACMNAVRAETKVSPRMGIKAHSSGIARAVLSARRYGTEGYPCRNAARS